MHSADYVVARCPSVRPLHRRIVSKRLIIITLCTFTTCSIIDHHSSFSVPNVMAIFGRWPYPVMASMGNWRTKIKWFSLFYMCYWTMGLASNKTSKVFCINICCFYTRFFVFLYHVVHTQSLAQVSSKLSMCSISTPHKTRMFTVRLAGNVHYQGNGFAVAVLALVMPLDHPNFAATVLRISLPCDQKAILNLKKYHIWSNDCHWISNLLYTFHQNWFTFFAPDAHNC